MNEFPLKVPLIIIKSRGAIKHHFPVGMRVMAQVKESITGSYRCIPLEKSNLLFQYVSPDCLSLPNYPAGIRARLTKAELKKCQGTNWCEEYIPHNKVMCDNCAEETWSRR